MTCCTDAIPSGAYAFADFANGCYWINGSQVTVADIAPDMAPGTDGFSFGWQATDAIVPGYGATNGWDFGGYFKLESSLAATLLTSKDYSAVLECVIDYSDFSIIENYVYDAAVSQLWDFFLGDAGGGFSTFEMDDYLNLIVESIGIPNASLAGLKKIGFSANQAIGAVSGAITGAPAGSTALPMSGTALAGHRSPPQAAWANLAFGISASWAGPGNNPTSYIKTLTLYASALSASALQTATDTATVDCPASPPPPPPPPPPSPGGAGGGVPILHYGVWRDFVKESADREMRRKMRKDDLRRRIEELSDGIEFVAMRKRIPILEQIAKLEKELSEL